MKTYEFIDKVRSLGYEVQGFLGIDIKKDGKEVVYIATDKVNRLSTYGTEGDVDPELFDLVLEYAKTPIEERKYELPNYIEYDGHGYFVGRRYHMGRHGELVIAKLAFGVNSCDNQPTAFSTTPGLRGPAAALTMQEVPDNFGFYWECEATENYDTRVLAFTDLISSTWLEDSPFEVTDKQVELFSEVKVA